MRIPLILIIIFFAEWAFAQQQPRFVMQRKPDDIQNMYVSDDSRYLWVEQGAFDKTFFLYDQLSKILIGQSKVTLSASPGAGRFAPLDSGKFVLSTNYDLLICDPVEGDTTGMLGFVEYPEIILAYARVSKDLWAIATKIYPEEETPWSTVTNNGRLLLFDAAHQKIEKQISTDFEITKIRRDGVLLNCATNKGEIRTFDLQLAQVSKYELVDKPILDFLLVDDLCLVAPFRSDDLTFRYGQGEIHVFDSLFQPVEKVILPKDIPDMDTTYMAFKPGMDNSFESWLEAEDRVFLNFGHAQLAELSLDDLKLQQLPVRGYQSIRRIQFNPDSTQILFAHGKWTALADAGVQEISYYDLRRDKVVRAFPEYLSPLEDRKFNYLKDQDGNYYLVTQSKTNYWDNNDTLNIYPSNRSERYQLACEGCKFFRPSDYWVIQNKYGTGLVYGQIDFRQLRNRLTRLSLNNGRIISQGAVDSLLFMKEGNLEMDFEHYTDRITHFEKGPDKLSWIEQNYKKKDESLYRFVLFRNNEAIRSIDDIYVFSGTDAIQVSPDWKYVVYTLQKGKKLELVVENLQTGEEKYSRKFDSQFDLNVFHFSDQNDLYYTAIIEDIFEFTRVRLNESGEEERLEDRFDFFFDFSVKASQDLLAVENYDHIKLYQLSTGELFHNFRKGNADRLMYDEDYQGFLISADNELWGLRENDFVRFLEFEGGKTATVYNNTHYKIDGSLLKNFGFSFLRTGYRLADFDAYFNRPDIILNALNSENVSFNRAVSTALQKRKKLQTDIHDPAEYLRNHPRIDIVNQKELPEITTDSHITLQARASDEIHQVTRLHVSINGVPVYGKKGKSIQKSDFEADLELLPGSNTIEVYAENNKGIISPARRLEIFYDQSSTSHLYYIALSVSDYQNDDFDLQYARKDGEDMRDMLMESRADSLIDLSLFDEEVTKARVGQIKKQLMRSSVNDQVIVFLSGHGLLDENFDFYFATHDVNFKKPKEKGLAYTDIEHLLDSIPARKKLLLMDACHSGEVDKEEIVVAEKKAESVENISFRGFKGYKTREDQLGLPNSFELMKELFADLRRGNGSAVISSASGVEFAFESPEWNNGVFTYALLEGLKSGNADTNSNGQVTISELKQYIFDRVYDLTDGQQNPTSRRENLEFDWVVW